MNDVWSKKFILVKGLKRLQIHFQDTATRNNNQRTTNKIHTSYWSCYLNNGHGEVTIVVIK